MVVFGKSGLKFQLRTTERHTSMYVTPQNSGFEVVTKEPFAVYYTVYSPPHKYIIHRLIWHLPDGVFFTSSNKVPKYIFVYICVYLYIFVCIIVYICVYSRCQPKEGRELPLTALYEPSSQRAFDFPSMAGTLNNSEIETVER